MRGGRGEMRGGRGEMRGGRGEMRGGRGEMRGGRGEMRGGRGEMRGERGEMRGVGERDTVHNGRDVLYTFVSAANTMGVMSPPSVATATLMSTLWF